MKKILANLKLYAGLNKRKTPFLSGYRPLFNIKGSDLKSGMITLIDRGEFFPGDEGVVEIKFLDIDASCGDNFYFSEGVEPLGECLVIKFLDADVVS